MDSSSQILSVADREWRRLGVLPRTRLDLAAELEADLSAAASDGKPLTDVVGDDPRRFAGDWAHARGDVPLRAYYLRSFVSAGVGLVVGALVAVGLIVFVSEAREFFNSRGNGVDFSDGGEPLLIAYLCTGLGAYLGVLASTWVGLSRRDDPFVGRTVIALSWIFGVGGAVAVGAGVGTAASLHYPASFHSFVVAEMILVISVMSAAILAARRVAVGAPALLAGPGDASAAMVLDMSS